MSVEPPPAAASAEIVKYGIHDIEVKVTAAANNLLFLSETYYPVGWRALVDGKETPIYRANYLFRAVVVPPGIHKLEMKFEPKGFYLGKNLSLGANILVLGAKFVKGKDVPKILDAWLTAEFEGGRHHRRFKQIKKIEKDC